MSPLRMINEWGRPPYYLESIIHGLRCYLEYEKMGVIPAGNSWRYNFGRSHSQGALVLSPLCEGHWHDRGPIASVMVTKTLVKHVMEGRKLNFLGGYNVRGVTGYADGEKMKHVRVENVFTTAMALNEKYGKDYMRLSQAL